MQGAQVGDPSREGTEQTHHHPGERKLLKYTLFTSYCFLIYHNFLQIKDAIHDGLRAVLNTINDGALVPGAGAFEVHTIFLSHLSLNTAQ